MYHKSRHRACRGFGIGSVAAVFSRAASFIRGSPKAGTAISASSGGQGTPASTSHSGPDFCPSPTWALAPVILVFLVAASNSFWTSSFCVFVSFVVHKDIFLYLNFFFSSFSGYTVGAKFKSHSILTRSHLSVSQLSQQLSKCLAPTSSQ